MEGRTHLLAAAAVGCAAYGFIYKAPLINIHSGSEVASGIALAAVILGGLAPDLDIPESTLSSKITPISHKALKRTIDCIAFAAILYLLLNSFQTRFFIPGVVITLFGYIFLKNSAKRILHYVRMCMQILAILVLFYFYLVTREKPWLFMAITLGLYVISRHRGISHGLPVNSLAAYTVYYSVSYINLPYAQLAAVFYLLGAASHLLCDYFTNRGIPGLLHPLDVPVIFLIKCIKARSISWEILKQSLECKKYRFPFTFSTGSAAEGIISACCIVLILFQII